MDIKLILSRLFQDFINILFKIHKLTKLTIRLS